MTQKSRTQGLNGLASLTYIGVLPNTPPNMIVRQGAPTTNDYRNVQVGDYWLDNSNIYNVPSTPPTISNLWILTSVVNRSATWLKFSSGGGTGTVVEVFGGTGINISGTPTVNPVVNLNIPVIIAHGGTNATTMTNTFGVNYFDGTKIATTTVGTAGFVLTSNGPGVAPNFQAASGSLTTLTPSVGGSVSPTMGNINIFGSGGVVTTQTASDTITITAAASVATSYVEDSGSATPAANILNILGAGGITTSGSGNTVTITGSSIGWVEVLGVTQAMAISTGYIANNAGLVTLTLPSVAAQGSIVRIAGKGAGGWKMGQNGGQTVYFGAATTTFGAAGSLASTNRRDCIEVLCITANTEWEVLSSVGTLTVV